MINIRIEDASDTIIAGKAEFHIEGKGNALAEFIAVLNALEKADKAIFAVALLKFFDSRVKEESNDKE